MPSTGRNEGIRLLEDFTCEAVSTSNDRPDAYEGRGKNHGMDLATELIAQISQESISSERIEELRRLSSRRLLEYVLSSTMDLSRQELLLIHDIAAERLGNKENPLSEGAFELSRQVMLKALNKSA